MIKRPIELEVEYYSEQEKELAELGIDLPNSEPTYRKMTIYSVENISLKSTNGSYDTDPCIISSGGESFTCKLSYNQLKKLIDENIK